MTSIENKQKLAYSPPASDPVTGMMGQYLGQKTDRICQFLGTETDIMDERYYIIVFATICLLAKSLV